MKLFKAALAAVLATLLIPAAAAHASFEVQGWETDARHIHTMTPDLTMFDRLSAPKAITVTTMFHNRVVGDHVTFVRWSCESDVMQTVKVNHQATGAFLESWNDHLTIDPGLCAHSGWQEIRLTANTALHDGTREFSTTRLCLFLANGKSRSDYCGGPTTAGRCGGGAWYTATLYLISYVDCRDVQRALTGTYKPGDVIRVRTQNTGGGIATFDPDFHHGNPGIDPQPTPPGNKWTTVRVPNLPDGPHVLHLRDRLSGFSGAYVMHFTVANPAAPAVAQAKFWG